MSVRTTVALALVLPLVACASESPPEDVVVLLDSGSLCLYGGEPTPFDMVSDSATQDYAVGDQLFISVRVADCLSSSCDVNRVASCGVTQDGQVLTVSSHLSYEVVDSPHCTMDCGMLGAVCASDALTEGSYTVVHGAESFAVDVPSSGAACLR